MGLIQGRNVRDKCDEVSLVIPVMILDSGLDLSGEGIGQVGSLC